MNTEKPRNVPDFFSELRQRLRNAGFEATVTEDKTLSVTCQKHPVCSVDCRGNIEYPPEVKAEEGFYTQHGRMRSQKIMLSPCDPRSVPKSALRIHRRRTGGPGGKGQ